MPMAMNGNGTLLGPVNRISMGDRPTPQANGDGEPIIDSQGWLLPHYRSFSAIYNAVSRTYRYTFDEALRHAPDNALGMRRDVTLMEMLRERQLPVAQLEWTLEPENEKDASQKGIAEDLAKIIRRTPRMTILLLNLLDAAWYGRYGVQMSQVWVTRGMRRTLEIRDHRPVNGDKIQFDFTDGTPGIFINASATNQYPQESIRYTDRNPVLMLDRPEWRRRFIVHRHEIDDADYFEPEMAGAVQGVGIRGRIYWAWWLRNEVLSWMMDYLQRAGMGLTVFYYDAGDPASKAAAEKAAKEYSRDTALAWPRNSEGGKTGSGIERLEAGEAGAQVIQSIMAYFDDSMRRYIVGQTLSSMTGATGLGSGVSELHADTKFRILKFDADNLADTLTMDLVKPMALANFGSQVNFDIRWKFSLDKPEPDKQLDAVKTAVDMGAHVPEREVQALIGVGTPEPGEPVLGGNAMSLPGGMGQPAMSLNKSQQFSQRELPLRYEMQTEKHDLAIGETIAGPHPESELVYIADRSASGTWDGHVIILGCISEAQAREAYENHYSADSLGNIVPVTVAKFRQWAANGDKGRPAAEQFSRS